MLKKHMKNYEYHQLSRTCKLNHNGSCFPTTRTTTIKQTIIMQNVGEDVEQVNFLYIVNGCVKKEMQFKKTVFMCSDEGTKNPIFTQSYSYQTKRGNG